MKKLVIELCCVIALAACGNGKEQKTVEEDATAKALLQGVWINDETELPLMRIEGKTVDELIDYSIYGYYGKWKAIPADTVSIAKQCPYAIEVTTARGDVKIDDDCLKNIRQNGWGYFAVYDLNNERSYEKEFSRISRLLYDDEVEWSGKQYERTGW